MELTIQKKKKWSIIAEQNFPHRNQHSIKNRVVSLLATTLNKNRKEVYNILKQDYMSHVRKAIKMIKIKKIKRKSEIKQETIENIPQNPEITHHETEFKVKQEEIFDRNCIFNLPSEEINLYNQLYQNHMALCFPSSFGAFNNFMLFKPWI